MTDNSIRDFFYSHVTLKTDDLSDDNKALMTEALESAVQYLVTKSNREKALLHRRKCIDRDTDIYLMKSLKNMTLKEIADKYNMSTTRVQQILKEQTHLLISREKFGQYSEMLSKHTINALKRYDIDNAEQLLELDLDKAYCFRGIGEMSLVEIKMWQDRTRALQEV